MRELIATEQLLPARPYPGQAGFSDTTIQTPRGSQSWATVCCTAVTTTEPAPTFPAGVPPTHIQEKQHEAIHQLDANLPQATPFSRKQKAGQKQRWLPREGFAFPQLIAGSWGQLLAQACLQHSRDAPIQLLNQSQIHFWKVGGEAQVQHIPPEERIFFSPLGSSHPSEKVPLLPVFYETPTHQLSNCSQHVLRFYVSNKKQLHLHKTCFFSNRLSPRGWSGVG